MLTSYLVKCPHFGCNWFGSLLPQGDTDSWRGSTAPTPTVMFACPKCEGQWKARVTGDDVEPLPLEELVPWA